MAEFLRSDFSTEMNRAKSIKNAGFLSGRKHNYYMAAAFFILGGKLDAGIQQLCNYERRPMVALLLARMISIQRQGKLVPQVKIAAGALLTAYQSVASEMRPISPAIEISHLQDGVGTQMEALALLCERVCTEESKQTKAAVKVLSAVPSVPLQVLLDTVKWRKEHQSDYDGSLQWLASGAVAALLQGQIRSYSGLDPHEHSEEHLGTAHEPAIKQATIVGDELESNSFVKMMALTSPALVSNAVVKSQLHQLCAADDRSLITQLSLVSILPALKCGC